MLLFCPGGCGFSRAAPRGGPAPGGAFGAAAAPGSLLWRGLELFEIHPPALLMYPPLPLRGVPPSGEVYRERLLLRQALASRWQNLSAKSGGNAPGFIIGAGGWVSDDEAELHKTKNCGRCWTSSLLRPQTLATGAADGLTGRNRHSRPRCGSALAGPAGQSRPASPKAAVFGLEPNGACRLW